jgi:hypothetical protein
MEAVGDEQRMDLRALSTTFSFRRQGVDPEKRELNVEKKKISCTEKLGRPHEAGDEGLGSGCSRGGRGVKKRKKSTHNHRVEASAYTTQSCARLLCLPTPSVHDEPL